jgi:Cu/Ag efflux protein CusF
MKLKSILALAIVAALSPSAFAQAQAPQAAVLAASAPGKAAMAGVVKVSAVVVAIDAASRTLTLKGAKGKIVDVVAPPEAKKFDQIRVGDTVTVEYARALTLELMPSGGSIRSSSTQAASAPAPAGAVAGGAVGRQVVIMANVTAVNTKESFVTLRGPKGNSVDLHVADPAQLKRVKVGDQVEAVYTEAVAITVDHTPKAAKK